MSKRTVIVVSFKNNKEDMELYDLICKHSDKSAFIKDTLREKVNNTKTTKRSFKKVNL